MTDAPSSRPPSWLQACRLLLLVHMGLALCGWWLLPQGFPASSPRFWINCVLPMAVVLAGSAALINAHRGRFDLLQNALIGLAVGWTVLPVAACCIFPVTGSRLLPRCLIASLGLWLICGVAFRSSFRCGRGTFAAIALAVLLAILVPWSQAGPTPTTGILFTSAPSAPEGEAFVPRGIEPLDDRLVVFPHEGSLSVKCGVKVNLQPLLTFESVSPDRNWSILSPPELRERSPPRCTGARRFDTSMILEYQHHRQWMSIEFDPAKVTTRVAAWSQLDAPCYSHLNTFNELTITGHRRLFLSFSPCPEVRVEALPFDYPSGRPAQLAYLDAGGTFHVVRARSGEKGPFVELGRGPLARVDPLIVTLFDDDQPACRITFFSWAGQVSTELSPTAGWGLPQNSIEFIRQGEQATSPVGIWMTLAATSVGRGWDTVGHRAGVFGNQVVIEPVQVDGK